MLRKTMIVLLTAAALTGGLTADAFARGGRVGRWRRTRGRVQGVAVIWAAGSAAAGHMGGGCWRRPFRRSWPGSRSRPCGPMPRCAATSAAITFIAADASIAASGSVAAMTTGATSTPFTNRIAICMGTDVFGVPLHDMDESFAGLVPIHSR